MQFGPEKPSVSFFPFFVSSREYGTISASGNIQDGDDAFSPSISPNPKLQQNLHVGCHHALTVDRIKSYISPISSYDLMLLPASNALNASTRSAVFTTNPATCAKTEPVAFLGIIKWNNPSVTPIKEIGNDTVSRFVVFGKNLHKSLLILVAHA